MIPGARGAGVGDGKRNTAEILAACDEKGSAADLCANYSLNGIRGWFLPSGDELALMYRNLKAAGLGDFGKNGIEDNITYWTSSQVSPTWRTTSISPTTAGRITTTKIFHAAFGPSDPSESPFSHAAIRSSG